jgi:hypothetical protein
MKTYLLTVLSLILFSSCEKEDLVIHFTGISKTDAIGSPLSIDSTDWNVDDIWSFREADLFNSQYESSCTPSHNYFAIAYPNPNNGVFALHFNKIFSTRVELRLVDENFTTLILNDSVTQDDIHLNAGTFGIHDTVRLYYKFIENNCEFRGHGDIIIE